VLPIVLVLLLVATTSGLAHSYDEIEVVSGGVVSGRVSFGGESPRAAFVPVLKNTDVCGERVPDERLLVSEDGGIAGVVVELEGVSVGKPRAAKPAVLDNERCAFVPRVQALVVGQSLEIRNSDPILHDAHARRGSQTVFNLGLPPWRRVSHVFTAPGLHEVDCNVLHTWVKAWIFVSEHPYAAVTGPDGRFSIADVPAGAYTLRFWHEALGELRRPVRVRASEVASVDVRMKPSPS